MIWVPATPRAWTPSIVLPLMTFRSRAEFAPTLWLPPPSRLTPLALPAAVPSVARPIQLPTTTAKSAPGSTRTPLRSNRLMTNPRTVTLPAAMSNPLTDGPVPARSPRSSMRGTPANPGWVLASRVSLSVIAGNGVSGWMVWTPAPGMANAIESAPAAALASRIAWRSEPSPLSPTVVTVNRAGTARSSKCSSRSLAVNSQSMFGHDTHFRCVTRRRPRPTVRFVHEYRANTRESQAMTMIDPE